MRMQAHFSSVWKIGSRVNCSSLRSTCSTLRCGRWITYSFEVLSKSIRIEARAVVCEMTLDVAEVADLTLDDCLANSPMKPASCFNHLMLLTKPWSPPSYSFSRASIGSCWPKRGWEDCSSSRSFAPSSALWASVRSDSLGRWIK